MCATRELVNKIVKETMVQSTQGSRQDITEAIVQRQTVNVWIAIAKPLIMRVGMATAHRGGAPWRRGGGVLRAAGTLPSEFFDASKNRVRGGHDGARLGGGLRSLGTRKVSSSPQR